MKRVLVVGFIIYSIISLYGQINNDVVEIQIGNSCAIDMSNTELICE